MPTPRLTLTAIRFVVPGSNHNPLAGQQGRTVHLEEATLRTDNDGLREAVINNATTVTEQVNDQKSHDDGDGDDSEQTNEKERDKQDNPTVRHREQWRHYGR